jgi:hypothetical protein
MKDITIIYLTANLVPESFAEYQRKILLEAIGDTPLISVSRKPMNFGMNILDTAERNVSNIYFQMLKAIKLANTDFIAMAEDDCLYPKEHFKFYRPDKDTFAYNQNRYALFTWDKPLYSWRDRRSNATLIAPREFAIEALEERFAKYPNGTPLDLTGELGRERVEEDLKVIHRKTVDVFSDISVIQFNHDYASEDYQRRHVKKWGTLRSYDIPHWGKAVDIVAHFK